MAKEMKVIVNIEIPDYGVFSIEMKQKSVLLQSDSVPEELIRRTIGQFQDLINTGMNKVRDALNNAAHDDSEKNGVNDQAIGTFQ